MRAAAGVQVDTLCAGADDQLQHFPKLVGDVPVTMPGKDGRRGPTTLVIGRGCGRRACPGTTAVIDADGITALCRSCVQDVLASVAAGDSAAQKAFRTLLGRVADETVPDRHLVELARAAVQRVDTGSENPVIRRLRRLAHGRRCAMGAASGDRASVLAP
ncbi:hypothetical protein MOQ72_36275 [Saccharopolyspora sp. K220]|uniref:hypothetical protein n=1 Tax=Saccharopolyspora soli TaxID=2926618 RepID=UPI001F576956|nr:hypothetical protein [Saccharopolyspora soli]MCI2422896.1 hypothetical protein [Saccharopolyspora soli]